MWEILEGVVKAFELIASFDIQVYSVAALSIYVSGAATLLATSWSLPIGTFIGLKSFRGRRAVKSIFNALISIPTVTLGLLLYLLLSRSGPLGSLALLYSPTAMIIGQALLVTPIIVSFSMSAVEAVDPEIRTLARTLGASETRASITMLRESIAGIVLAVVSSFNRAISELGIALMVGGNIRGVTRVLTTSIALETARGELVLGIALTIVLLAIAYSLNLVTSLLVRR